MISNFSYHCGKSILSFQGPLSLKVAVKSMPPDRWVVVGFFSSQPYSICRLQNISGKDTDHVIVILFLFTTRNPFRLACDSKKLVGMRLKDCSKVSVFCSQHANTYLKALKEQGI